MQEMKEVTEEEIARIQACAIELRGKGYNCAQCVLMSLSDRLGLNEDLAAKATAAFGSGFAATGEICGAMSALGIAEGFEENDSSPQAKLKAMKSTHAMFERFKKENGGRFRCSDLKGKTDTRSCPDLIRQAIRIFLDRTHDL
ncbi:MAG: C-GCAxxG-C-C family protein [Muribaculaceae bacterium]|nr:C-GCAxxG-C-C family protein [Muribaculaceae bacterium]